MAIDVHAHWTPRGPLQQSAPGRDWYGWRILTESVKRDSARFGRLIKSLAIPPQ